MNIPNAFDDGFIFDASLPSFELFPQSDTSMGIDELCATSDDQSTSDDGSDTKIRRFEKWSSAEESRLRDAVELHGTAHWKLISDYVRTKSNAQCRQRWSKCSSPTIVKGRWRPDEDRILLKIMNECRKTDGNSPIGGWKAIADKLPGRTTKQCRERWMNYLNPDVIRGPFSSRDDLFLAHLFKTYGNQWAKISKKMPGRTEQQVRVRVEHLKLADAVIAYNEDAIKAKNSKYFKSLSSSKKIISKEKPFVSYFDPNEPKNSQNVTTSVTLKSEAINSRPEEVALDESLFNDFMTALLDDD